MSKEFTKMQMWNFISYSERMELVKEFGITSSAPREVANNVLVKDGIMEQDLEEVPIERLADITGLPAVVAEREEAEDREEEAVKLDEEEEEEEALKKGDEVKVEGEGEMVVTKEATKDAPVHLNKKQKNEGKTTKKD